MNFFERIIAEPVEKFSDKVLYFLPNFLAAVLVLAVGAVLSLILKAVFLRLFKAIGIDRFSERFGAVEVMKMGGVKDTASVLLAKLIAWLTVIIFAVISMSVLELPSVERLLERFLLYLPNMFVAALILFLGHMAGNFLGRTALITAVNAGLGFTSLIGKSVRLTVFVLSMTMALEQLGIGKETVIIAFAIILGGIVLALSIAFGLGGRDLAKVYLERKSKGEEKDEINHL